MKICLYGASSTKTEDKYIDAVENLCEKFARRGHSLVFGAGANGLMGAAARGFTAGGGHILGIAPGFFDIDGIIYDKCDELIRPETMRERKKLLEDNADVFLVVPGGVGTFDEFFEILTLKQLGRHSKAIVIYNLNGYYDKLQDFMNVAKDEYFVSDKTLKLYEIFDDGDKIIEYIENDVGEKLTISDTKYV
jgi:uncharacterized protein (TIGR00730 family)